MVRRPVNGYAPIEKETYTKLSIDAPKIVVRVIRCTELPLFRKIKTSIIAVFTVEAQQRSALAYGLHTDEKPSHSRPMIKYLNSRECPRCSSTIRIMLLKFNPKISTINGICRRCDYSIKWQIIEGSVSTARDWSLRKLRKPALQNSQSIKLEVLR